MTAILDVADTATKGFDADEVAFALNWTSSGARSQLRQARYLRDVLPSVLAALCAGEIDSYQAWVFFDVLWRADDEVAVAVVGRVLPQASELTGPQLRRKLRRELFKADPDGYAERTRKGVETRCVGTTASNDGTSTLFGVHLPVDRAAAAFERVDALARGARAAGDQRNLDQLRAIRRRGTSRNPALQDADFAPSPP